MSIGCRVKNPKIYLDFLPNVSIVDYMRKVEVVPHNPRWRYLFEIESQAVAKALVENVVNIHHIGSTAIPSIYAKPIIDLLVEVENIKVVDSHNSMMENIGYQVMGEFGISNRRFFRKDNSEGDRTHHVHMFPINSPQIRRHLSFRDYLINHSEEAKVYSNLKRKLAQQHPDDIESYMDGKDQFIKNIDIKAAQKY